MGARLLYDSGDKIFGTGFNSRGTQITNTSGAIAAMIAYVHGTGGTGAYGPEISELQLYGTGTTGSVGLDLRHTLEADVQDISTGKLDTGMIIGLPGGCDCYNSFRNVHVGGITYGAEFLGGSNQNQWYGGSFSGNTGLYIAGAANQFFAPDFESDTTAVHFTSASGYGATGNTLFTPYFEANKTNVLLDPGIYSNAIIGGSWSGGISDNSRNTSNWMFGTGSSAAPGGYQPKTFGAGQFNVGGNLLDNGTAHLTPDPGGSIDAGVDLNWSSDITRVYGRQGGANLHSGALYSSGGANLNTVTIIPLPNPAAPTITQRGPTGTAFYSYYVACHTPIGYHSLPSSAGSTLTGSATLSSVNYNTITYSCGPGYNCADILKGGTSGTVLLSACITTKPNGSVNDTGQALSAYTPPSRNSTGDMRVSGMSISEGLHWPLPPSVVNGASFYCPNCDQQMNPPDPCTSHGTRTGSWVHGLNSRWICTP